jgi:hypothetical protein
MKKVFLVPCVLLISMFYFTACSGGSGSDDDGPVEITDASVTKVAAFTAGDVEASGATTVPSTEEDFAYCVEDLFGEEVLSDLYYGFADIVPAFSMKDRAARRAVTGDLNTFMANIEAALEALPTNKTVNESYSQSNVVLGSGFTAKTIGATIKADVTTTNSAAADLDEYTNLNTLYGKMGLNADIKKSEEFVGSGIVDAKLRINLAAEASIGTVAGDEGREPANLVFTGAVSSSLAVSYNAGGTGGIILMTADVSQPVAKIADLSTSDAITDLKPTTAVSIKMCRDNGTVAYSKSFTDLGEFWAWMDKWGVEF